MITRKWDELTPDEQRAERARWASMTTEEREQAWNEVLALYGLQGPLRQWTPEETAAYRAKLLAMPLEQRLQDANEAQERLGCLVMARRDRMERLGPDSPEVIAANRESTRELIELWRDLRSGKEPLDDDVDFTKGTWLEGLFDEE